MLLIDIVTLGYLVNIVGFILFTISMVAVSLVEIGTDPKKILELKQLENNISELARLNNMLSFKDKHTDFLAFLIPFSAIPKYYMVLKKFSTVGVMGYIDEQIQDAKKKIEQRKNG